LSEAIASWRAAAVGVLVAAVPSAVSAQPAPADAPCTGCVVVMPPGAAAGPLPLLVVLHGDEGSPGRLVSAWKRSASEAGVVLFAPRCPTEEGCSGSWWRWGGDPAWLERRVSAIEAKHPIDPARRFLAGWSGGATYLGLFAPRWFPRFAAVSLAGGGAPPSDRTTCAPPLRAATAAGACAPVHYLMGDKNPLFSLAESTRDYLRACRHAVTWELLPGKDHGGEWRAYAAPEQTTAILGWLLSHPQGCDADADAAAPPGDAGVAEPAREGPALHSDETRAPPALPPSPATGSRCGCHAPGAAAGWDAGAWILGAALLASRRRRSPSRQWYLLTARGRSPEPSISRKGRPGELAGKEKLPVLA